MITKRTIVQIVGLIICFVGIVAGQAARPDGQDFPRLAGPYLGQKPPGPVPEVFAPGILSRFSMLHGKIVFSPGGLEAFWSCNAAPVQSRWTARQTLRGVWAAPEPSLFSIEYIENSMCYSADGKRLCFQSRRPLQGTGAPKDKDIWYREKTSEGWGDPVPLGPPVNTPISDESAPSLAADGTLFFARQESTAAHGAPGHGAAQIDIYYSDWRSDAYAEPVKMGPEINSEYPEIDPVIAPDKSYLLFSSARPGGYSRMMNLYVSFRTADGRWTPAQSLSHTLKIDNIWFPSLSADGAYLFFCGGYPTDKGYTDSQYYWVDAKIVETLRPREKDGRGTAAGLASSLVVGNDQKTDLFYQGGLIKLFAQAAAAENQRDRAYEILRSALAAAPEDPIVLWHTATAAARLGRVDEAVVLLERLGRLKTGWDLSANIKSKTLLENPRFLAAAKSGALPDAHRAAEAFSVAEDVLITEGLAYDARTKILYLGNVQKQKILAVRPDGKAADFARAGQDGLRQVLGMEVDPERNLLWAVSNGPDYGLAEAGRGFLHAFDLATGRTVEKYEAPGGKTPHLLNDLEIVRGDVYVTDSQTGAVHRWEAKTKTFAEFLPAGTFIYPNGLASDPAGRKLFVAGWPTVAIVDLASRGVAGLRYAAAAAPTEIDGLYYYRGSLIGIQNGVGSDRLARFFLNESEDEIVRMEILESGNPKFEIPTTGAVAGDAFYLIANSQLGRAQNGVVVRPTEPVLILRVPLEK